MTTRTKIHNVSAPQHAHLPAPIDVLTLSRSLDIDIRSLWHLILTNRSQYKIHRIPKKSGGRRTLHVPSDRLAYCQRRILQTYLNPLVYPPEVKAYVPTRKLVESAQVHAGSAALIVVDLKDFFPSTRRAWVKEALSATYGFSEDVTRILASLVTTPWDAATNAPWIVPQGAPTSGAVANIVAMHRLDPLIRATAEAHGMRYTRYADDLAFSPQGDEFVDKTKAFIGAVIQDTKSSGYRVNYDKIRVQRQHRQQRLLGMTVNEKPNVPRREFRKICALAHNYTQRGDLHDFVTGEELEAYLTGIVAHYQGINPRKAELVRKRCGFMP